MEAWCVLVLGHQGRHVRCTFKSKRTSAIATTPNDTTYGSSPEGRKLDGNSVLVVIHTNGVHHLPFVKCCCMETRTVFTFELLDLYLAETLECHTATHSFYSKLRRLTNESFPSSVPDRYRELLRVGRQWRNIKELIFFAGEGELALFCAACPQPGINLPKSWWSDPEQWVYTRVNVMDGNFVCIHRMLKNQEGDLVWLKGNGKGFMTSKGPYDAYLENAVETKRGKAYKGCDASGIGAAACGRQEPSFQPPQMNMDYCWTKSVQYGRMKDAPHLLYLYDINCQYPESCLARFSPSFISGAGRVGGEILESLWSTTNDVLDANLNDSNTKKIQEIPKETFIANTLSEKLLSSAKELDEARADFDHLDSSASPNQRKAWPALLQRALNQRKTNLKAMDIFTAHISKPKSRRAIQTKLINEENSKGENTGGVPKWLALGIDIQQLQASHSIVRRCSDSPTEAQAYEIATRREQILLWIQEHTNLAGTLFPCLTWTTLFLSTPRKPSVSVTGLFVRLNLRDRFRQQG
ncbi:hypothetical protein FA13DRAFT_1758863 [Coprinellus micaceus]|uniref:CxC2-like cysteine cluster KDZ transposase-associated domain-containing protein n=1 Tax=Coprinellus micaceus TaxID=71717 RepID=A0A4Y7S9B7_COPMI|nr:hypothetical protein FA13DRAFT_1758863 [Coprinellus micaceus]